MIVIVVFVMSTEIPVICAILRLYRGKAGSLCGDDLSSKVLLYVAEAIRSAI